MGYGGIKRVEAAEVMGVKPGQLDRIIGTKGNEAALASWDQLWRLADHVGLRREFFSADLELLAEIVPEDGPRFEIATRRGRGVAGSAAQRLSGSRPSSRGTPGDEDAADGGT